MTSLDTMVPIGKVCDVESLGEVRLSGTAYCGNIDYDVLSDGSLTAKRVRNSEGYITNLKNQTSSPAHYTRDIQGNVISVLSMSDGYPYQGSIYYADGLLKSKSFSNSFQPYLYSGKELMKMHGYDCYDYGARHSYTALGRFTTIDPLAENDPGTSPYVLCKGNPIRYVDPDGRESRSWEDKLGDWMRETFNSHSEIQVAKSLEPIAEGAVLINPVVGLANDVITISTDNDMFGNQASSLDKGIATVDMLSFGVSKIATTKRAISYLGKTATIENVSKRVNKSTTFLSLGKILYDGYEKQIKKVISTVSRIFSSSDNSDSSSF